MTTASKNQGTDSIHSLINEVFEATGKKLTADDPLVAAAMVQSSLVRSAVAEACQSLSRDITEAARQTKSTADSAAQLQAELVSNRLSQSVQQMLTQSMGTAAVIATSRLRLAVLLVVSALAGAAIAYFSIPHLSSPSQAQSRLMHNGALLDQVWPTLPAETKRLFLSKPADESKSSKR